MRGKLIASAIMATLAVVATNAASASTAVQSMPISVVLSKPLLNKPVAGKTTFIISVNKLKGRPTYSFELLVAVTDSSGHDFPASFPAHPGLKMIRGNYFIRASSIKPFRLTAVVGSDYGCFSVSAVVMNGNHPWVTKRPIMHCTPPAG